MRDVLVLVVGLLPASGLKNLLLRLLGHAVDKDARINPCLFLGVGRIEVAAGARIGTLNTFRRLTLLRLDRNTLIGQLNWCSAAPFLVTHVDPASAGVLHLEAESAITQRHYLDASGGIVIEECALLAGVRSVLLTHEVDVDTNRLVAGPLRIGHHALISSNAKLVMGSLVPARSLVAMGSVVTRGLTTPGRLYAGVPARDKGAVDGVFFERARGDVPTGPAGPRTTPAPVD